MELRELEVQVLRLVQDKSGHGYDLVHRYAHDFSLAVVETSQIYYALRKLKQAGLLRNYTQKTTKAPDRKVYVITQKGRVELEKAARKQIGILRDLAWNFRASYQETQEQLSLYYRLMPQLSSGSQSHTPL